MHACAVIILSSVSVVVLVLYGTGGRYHTDRPVPALVLCTVPVQQLVPVPDLRGGMYTFLLHIAT